MIVRTGTLTAGSNIITGLRRTSDMQPNLNVYGTGIPVGTTIDSLDNSDQISLSQGATVSGSQSLEITTANVGTYHERNCILQDIKNIVDERGDLIQFFFRKEDDVSRDRYNSVKKRLKQVQYNIRAYPVEFRPSEKQLEKAGIREDADVTMWTAMKDWIDNGIDFSDFERNGRNTVILQNVKWEVRDIGLVSQVNDTYGYITFGLKKK